MTTTITSFELPYYSYKLFDVTFFQEPIKTLVTRSPCIVDTWISDMCYLHYNRLHRHNLIVGLDIEWRPNFEPNLQNPPATLQLCIGHNCLIFQLLFAPLIPQTLTNFLANTDFTFVGVGIDGDLQKLFSWYGLVVGNTVDLRGLAADWSGKEWLRHTGLVNISRYVLGKNFQKPVEVTLSNWDNEWLSLDQIQYACVDAYVSFEIDLHAFGNNHLQSYINILLKCE
ncbi:hypothetical protein LguiA_035155 [Lonicera macranthoides]